ncbi:sensor histidine kinase [Halalkalibacter alkaliphilus]|uniref:Histidine kinase n=1 Tax=Halalkalibacter alkaliphilus TaxID=2917993 RepID=A0A9X2I5Q4_9BACI|nr:sensor histidine kinase [Halalkalibacter alkaliphilus]MCL7748477.1 histidine kinase [Halalkalibacter alkaliphilus]
MKDLFYKLHQQLSIKTKLIVAFFTVALLSVFLMASISYVNYTQSVKHDFYRLSNEATLRLNQHIEFYMVQLGKSTSSLLTGDLLQSWMKNEREFSTSEIDSIQNELRKNIALNYPEIVGMFLVTTDLKVLEMTNLPLSGNHSYTGEPWYSNSFHHDIRVLPTHIINYPIVNDVRVVSIEVPVYSIVTLELLGKLVIDLELNELERIFDNANLVSEGSFFAISEDDLIVYHENYDWLGISRSETDLVEFNLSSEEKASIQNVYGQRQLVSISKSESTGWTFVYTVPLDKMASAMQNTPNIILITLLIIVVSIVIIVPWITNRFVKPILDLKQFMLRVEKGDLHVRAPEMSGNDEIFHLNRSFNNMVEQIDELLSNVTSLELREANLLLREKEAIIQALQNQIDPHFLYNSLDIIKSIAYMEDVSQIVTMSRNLADFYRYTAKNVTKVVTLREELEHLKHYLALIQVRFPVTFHSQINVDDKFLECTVIKLMIQPLVENAIKYAIEPNDGKGSIIVSAHDEDGELVIKITNTGLKIDDKKIEILNRKISSITDNVHEEYRKQQSLGIANVHCRIVLKYGKQYGVSIAANHDEETVVFVRLPI